MRRLHLLWGYWLAIGALLIGTMFLCSGFLRGPGASYLLLPFPLLGLVAACVVAVRNTPTGGSRIWQAVLVTGTFAVLMYVPTWLWWGWLEWKVRTIPVPREATMVRRSTGGVPFDGRPDCGVWFTMSLSMTERDRLDRLPPHELPAAWTAVSDAVTRQVHSFYHNELIAKGWEETPQHPEVTQRPAGAFAAFSRRGETLLLIAYPNTWSTEFGVEFADPLPPFGRIHVPGPPWSNPPPPRTLGPPRQG
jgi:hypothetical protein